MNNTTENKTVNKKICGLKLPQEVNDYIRNRAKTENRSLANVIAMIVMDYFSNLKDEFIYCDTDSVKLKQKMEENEK